LTEACKVIEIKRYLNGRYYDDGVDGYGKDELYKSFEEFIQKRRM